MERSVKAAQTDKSEVIRWRKTGGGTFRMASGRIIKTNQVFSATVDEVPAGFRHLIVPLEKLPEERPLTVSENKYTVQSAGKGWYDVIDSQGKTVNEKALRQEPAQELIETLTQ